MRTKAEVKEAYRVNMSLARSGLKEIKSGKAKFGFHYQHVYSVSSACERYRELNGIESELSDKIIRFKRTRSAREMFNIQHRWKNVRV